MENNRSILVFTYTFIQILSLVNSSPSCGNKHGRCSYVPAKPGHTPACASAGSTYCENAGHDYPEDLISQLLKSYPAEDMITDETETEFQVRKRFTHNYHYGPYNHHANKYGRRNKYYVDFQSNEQIYPRNSPSYHQMKPSSFNYGDFYQRHSREVRSIIKEPDKVKPSDEFLKSISPRNKRQISPNREELCEIQTKFINPQAGLNSRGNWLYIVNGATATQLVKTETCASTECSNLCQLPNSYESRCEQKYVQKRLIALDQSGEKLYNDAFWFPSCCVCTLSNTS